MYYLGLKASADQGEKFPAGPPLCKHENHCGKKLPELRLPECTPIPPIQPAGRRPPPIVPRFTPLPELFSAILQTRNASPDTGAQTANELQHQPLSEAANRRSLIVEHFEHGVKFGDLQQVLDPLAQTKQFQLAAVIGYGRETGNHFSNPRAIDVGNLTQVDQNFLFALVS
jgi:hypothetical protein